jgi:hypothetical protein
MLSFKNFVSEALDAQQRRKLAQRMKKNKAKIKMARKRAERKFADMDTLKKRARRQARNAMAAKLVKDMPKDELSVARKKGLEKRLSSPQMQARIDRQSKKLIKTVRKQEVERKRNRNKGDDKK